MIYNDSNVKFAETQMHFLQIKVHRFVEKLFISNSWSEQTFWDRLWCQKLLQNILSFPFVLPEQLPFFISMHPNNPNNPLNNFFRSRILKNCEMGFQYVYSIKLYFFKLSVPIKTADSALRISVLRKIIKEKIQDSEFKMPRNAEFKKWQEIWFSDLISIKSDRKLFSMVLTGFCQTKEI